MIKKLNTKSNQSINQIRKYVWLVSQLYHSPNGMTRDEINEQWAEDGIDGSDEIPSRTLHKWINAIWDIFHVSIENDHRGDFRYRIDRDEIDDDLISKWMLETISVGSMLHGLRDRVLLTDKPTGNDKLETILGAMEKNKTIFVKYQGFWEGKPETFDFNPYWVELQNQRWYVIGKRIDKGSIENYSVDRIEEMAVYNDRTYALPKDKQGEKIQPSKHYARHSGLETDGMTNVKVRLYVEANQQKYISTLKLDPSQEEVETTNDYSIFEYTLPTVTYDFIMKIFSYTPYVIVLSPKELANEIAWRAQ